MKKSMSNNSKRLLRSKSDRIVAGVSAGLAEYFEIDPIIVRLLFVLVTFTVGSGILIYIVLWIVMPEEGDEEMSGSDVVKKNTKEFEKTVDRMANDKNNQNTVKLFFGLALTLFGVYLVFANLGLIQWLNLGWLFSNFWPLILIFIGLSILVGKKDEK
jgi:phage shock protein C